jgi:uncharacterized membrane protein HdeD (DUF308 family)
MLNVICGRWWVLLLRGIAAIALGICAMAWPGITILALVLLFGTFSLINGIFSIMLGIRGEPDGTIWWTMVILGVLAVAAGIGIISYAFTRPVLSLWVFATIIAATAMAHGLFEIYAAIRLRHEIDDEWILGLSGLMSVLFGGLIMFRPGAGVIAIALLVGAYMMAVGILAVALSLRLRQMNRSLTSSGL